MFHKCTKNMLTSDFIIIIINGVKLIEFGLFSHERFSHQYSRQKRKYNNKDQRYFTNHCKFLILHCINYTIKYHAWALSQTKNNVLKSIQFTSILLSTFQNSSNRSWRFLCEMDNWQKAFCLILSWGYCQRFSLLQVSVKPRAGFEHAQNLFQTEWKCAELITTSPPCHREEVS